MHLVASYSNYFTSKLGIAKVAYSLNYRRSFIYFLVEIVTADREIAALKSSVSKLEEEKKEQALGKLYHNLYVKSKYC